MNRPALLDRLHQRHYLALLVCLLLMAILHPVLRGRYVGQGTLNALFSLTSLTLIFAVSRRKQPLLCALALGVPAIAVGWFAYAVAYVSPEYFKGALVAREVVALAFLAFAVAVVLYDVLQGRGVTADKLCGAMCVYLMIGLMFAAVHTTVETLEPGSYLNLLGDDTARHPLVLHGRVSGTLTYYSFVTLSTLGYGDILPATAAARTFSWLEAVLGQLYLAVLIARLVGLHIVQSGVLRKE